MCGFVGEIAKGRPVDGAALARMAAVLHHRGPDEGGQHVAPGGAWGVAHRRLCILDAAGGRQPFARDGLTLVYNGEIYGEEALRRDLAARGWEFRTRSDTEIVLALYAVHGDAFLEHLRGEYAFALFDAGRRRALLVRDRLGTKPLFTCRLPDALLFASEIKALFRDPRVPREWDTSGLCGAILATDVPGRSVFRDVFPVKPAHVLRVDLDSLAAEEVRYWDPWEARVRDVPSSFAGQVEAVRATVEEATDIRLRADVPVGTALSGGLDSSIVTARVAGQRDGLDAFAISFRESPTHDEWDYARALADRYPSVRLHEIPLRSEHLVAGLPAAAWHLERPFGNPHGVAKLLAARFARRHVGCLLTGEGGDETFCGYPSFWMQRTLQEAGYRMRDARRALEARRREESGIGHNRQFFAGVSQWRLYRTAHLVDRIGYRPVPLVAAAGLFRHLKMLMRRDVITGLRGSPINMVARHLREWMPREEGLPHALLLQHQYLTVFGPEYICTLADRTEYAGSLEARMPLFDHKLVELAMGLPLESKLAGDREKHVLREAFRDRLPGATTSRRKQAFMLPPPPLASETGRALLATYLAPAAIRDAGIFRPAAAAVVRAAHRIAPRHPVVTQALLVMLTTQMIHRHFLVDPGASVPPPPEV